MGNGMANDTTDENIADVTPAPLSDGPSSNGKWSWSIFFFKESPMMKRDWLQRVTPVSNMAALRKYYTGKLSFFSIILCHGHVLKIM